MRHRRIGADSQETMKAMFINSTSRPSDLYPWIIWLPGSLMSMGQNSYLEIDHSTGLLSSAPPNRTPSSIWAPFIFFFVFFITVTIQSPSCMVGFYSKHYRLWSISTLRSCFWPSYTNTLVSVGWSILMAKLRPIPCIKSLKQIVVVLSAKK